MPAALWTVVSSADGSGPFIGIVGDAEGAEYVGTTNPRLSEARVEAIAERAERPPMTAGQWINVASYGLGRVKLSRFRVAADRAKARVEVEAQIKVMNRQPSPERASKLAGIAESHYVFSVENAEAHDERLAEGRQDYASWNADWAAGPEAEEDFITESLDALR